uniref:Dihydrouridine synthase TIM-barrel protein nifR3 n=1 Tax=mine drainage metagenome TaxID=410659 RepID=E6PYU3_9ZZZZ
MAGKGFTVKKDWDNPIEHAMPAEASVPARFVIGPGTKAGARAVTVAPATVLAPMAGVTDTVFRRFIRHASLFTANSASPANSASVEDSVTNQQSGCGLLMTEFTSADGLSRMRESKRKRYLTFYDDEHPIAAQLFGSNAETLAEAARIVEDSGFDTVDLNLGCPAKRVVGCNGGSGLLRDLPKIAEIFRAIRASVAIPFTVKFRMGWNDSNVVCVELARMAEAEGLNAVALHARTREQGYTGQARWEWIAAVKDAVTIPVIGNGDIRTPEDAAAMVDKTGCDAVMIGRAAPSNPWIFRQIAEYTATGSYARPTEADRYRMIRTYFQMLLDEAEASQQLPRDARHGETAGKMKQFASWFTHGVAGGAKLRQQIFVSKTGSAVLEAVDQFFDARLNATNSSDCEEELAVFPLDDHAMAGNLACEG